MRLVLGVMIATLASGGVARAQGAAQTAPDTGIGKGYVEAVGQSSFGSVTSQSFGVEAGVTIAPRLQVFVEAGRTNDVAPSELGADAQRIAGSLSQVQSNVAFTVKEPATFFDAGIRFALSSSTTSRVHPYVMAGFGFASLTKDVRFTAAGADITSSLEQPPYYVTLGSDLTGSSTHALILGGGGVLVPIYKQLVLDFQLRLSRIFAEDDAITVGRAGVGIGFKF
jgi:hypothetical protein